MTIKKHLLLALGLCAVNTTIAQDLKIDTLFAKPKGLTDQGIQKGRFPDVGAAGVGDFRPGGQVTVTVSCTVATEGLALIDPPSAGATTAMDHF